MAPELRHYCRYLQTSKIIYPTGFHYSMFCVEYATKFKLSLSSNMATLKLKSNVRQKVPLRIKKAKQNADWFFGEVGVMRHESGFKVQFFSDEECEITHIPEGMDFTTIRELTSKAIKLRKRRLSPPQ